MNKESDVFYLGHLGLVRIPLGNWQVAVFPLRLH